MNQTEIDTLVRKIVAESGKNLNEETIQGLSRLVQVFEDPKATAEFVTALLSDVVRFAHLARKAFPDIADAVERFREQVNEEMEEAPEAVEAKDG